MEVKEALMSNLLAHTKKLTFANACQMMRWYFHPMGFEAYMDAPESMVARLFERASCKTLLVITRIPCVALMNASDVQLIIDAVENDMEVLWERACQRS